MGVSIVGTTFTLDVKKALNAYLNRMEQLRGLVLSKGSLTKLLNDRGIKVSRQTIEDIFNENEEKNINFEVIVGICQVLGISVTDLLPQKTDPFSGQTPAVWENRPGSDLGVETLPPRFYEGQYHCYYFRPMHLFENSSAKTSETETQTILHAVLTLAHENGVTKATLQEQETQYNFYGSSVMDSLAMEGTANLLIHTNQVQVNVRDNRGIRFMSIMFPYIHLAKDVLYSQVGALFNISTGKNRHPLFQKMAIFRKEIDMTDQQIESVVRGVLSMNSNQILIEKSKLEALEAKYPTIAQFPRKETPHCIFYEDHIYTSMPMLEGVDYMELSQALMHLRNASTSPAVLTIREHERYNLFSKHIQLHHPQKP
jgi:DNA-binding Xre family transcriptional regulator